MTICMRRTAAAPWRKCWHEGAVSRYERGGGEVGRPVGDLNKYAQANIFAPWSLTLSAASLRSGSPPSHSSHKTPVLHAHCHLYPSVRYSWSLRSPDASTLQRKGCSAPILKSSSLLEHTMLNMQTSRKKISCPQTETHSVQSCTSQEGRGQRSARTGGQCSPPGAPRTSLE